MTSTKPRTTRIARYFDLQAERWEAEHGPASARAAGFHACVDYLAALCREFGRPRVLDVGCAAGQHLLHLAPVIRAGVGLDLAPRMIERARAAAGRHGAFRHLHFEVGDAAALSPGDLGRFDLVLFIGVLEHVPERGRALRAAADLLDPAGRVVVVMPNPEHRAPPRIFASDRHFTADELARYGRRAGLAVERIDRLTDPLGRPPSSAAATWDTFAVRFRRAAE